MDLRGQEKFISFYTCTLTLGRSTLKFMYLDKILQESTFFSFKGTW
jgi:hypothetical protein